MYSSTWIVTILSFLILHSASGSNLYDCPTCVKSRVGKAEYVSGPLPFPLDNPFFSLNVDGLVLGYSANGDSNIIVSGNINDTLKTSTIALECGTTSNFDECGSWLNSAEKDDSAGVIRGWYHGESKCDYDIGQTHKSVAYAESRDGGKTFTKPNYPYNQVLTGTASPTYGKTTGNGDMSVIDGGDGYYYMFFIAWDDYGYCVARSAKSDGGVPGSWVKYYNGAYSQPGLGGAASGVDNLVGATVHKHYSGNLISVGNGRGVSMAFGSDALHWKRLSQPLIWADWTQWTRSASATEMIAYPGLVPLEGGNGDVADSFWLYYTYIQPGEGYGKRYLVRREVTLSYDASSSAMAGVELSRYRSGTVMWSTTTLPLGANYNYEKSLGYVLTVDLNDATVPLFDCHVVVYNSYMLTTNQADCSNGITFLRQIGWIYKYKPASGNVLPLYRCFNAATKKHTFANNNWCDGNGTLEYILGWTMQN